MSFVPDGIYVWNKGFGPSSIILLDADNVDYPVIDSTNDGVGDTIGVLTALSDDPDDIFTYSIVSDADGKFAIDGNLLKAAATFNVNQVTSHTVTIRATDQDGNYVDVTYILTVDASVGGPVLVNVTVVFDSMVGSADLGEATVGVNHVITLLPVDNGVSGAPINSMENLQQVHVVALDAVVGSGVLDEMDVEEIPSELLGTGVLDAMVVTQQHTIVIGEQEPYSGVLGKMQVNAIIFVEQLGRGILGEMTDFVQLHTLEPPELLGQGVLGELTGVEQRHAISFAAVTGSGALDDIVVAQVHEVTFTVVTGNSALANIVVEQNHALGFNALVGSASLANIDPDQNHAIAFNSLVGTADLGTMTVTET